MTECRVNTVWLNCYGDPKADRILNRAAKNSKRQSSILLSLSLRHVLFRDTKTFRRTEFIGRDSESARFSSDSLKTLSDKM